MKNFFLYHVIAILFCFSLISCSLSSEQSGSPQQPGQSDVSSVPSEIKSCCAASSSSSSCHSSCPYAKQKQAEAKKNCGCNKNTK